MNASIPEPIPLPITPRRFISVMLERKVPIAAFVFGVAVITALVAWFSKPWYTAEATLLPPSENTDVFSNLAGLIETSALNRVGLLSTSTPSDVYVEILKSRRLREALIKQFHLDQQYDLVGMDRTLKELDQHVKVDVSAVGIVVIKTEAQNKQQSADMANFLVAELDRFNREVLNTKGKRSRQFLEMRLAEIESRMHSAENKLTEYERAHRVVVSTDDAAVRGFADVMAQKLNLQVKRAYVSSYSLPGSPVVREMDAELNAFDKEMATLPELKNEGARLALDATIQRKLFTFLTAQYEDARLQEMRDVPTVTLLDEAKAPEIRSRPRRTIMVLVATFVAFLLASGWTWVSLRRSTA